MSDPLLRVVGLEKRFGAVTALSGIDLEVPRRRTLAVVGPNGAGKSTLLRVMAGLAHPSAGRLETAAAGPPRAGVGYLGHRTQLYPELTARENLVFAGRLYGVDDPQERADELLGEEGLGEFAGRLAGGFSRGMAQRLSIARARVHDPELLLLDEPYTGLDRRAADRLTARFAGLRESGHTLVVVTHDMLQASALADAVAILVAGELRALLSGADTAPERLEAAYLAEIDGGAPA